MHWTIRVGRAGFERSTHAGVTTFSLCFVTSTSRRTAAQVTISPNAGRTTSGQAGSNPACQAEHVWQNVLSTLVGID